MKVQYIIEQTGDNGFRATKEVEIPPTIFLEGHGVLFPNKSSNLGLPESASRAIIASTTLDGNSGTLIVHLEPDFDKMEEVIEVDSGWSKLHA